jgi:predicted DNA-binding protein
MTRTATVAFQTTEENKARLQDRADDVDQSLSTYGHHLIENYLDETSDTSVKYSELEDILANLREEITTILTEFQSETGQEIRAVQSVRTAYLIAIWKLLEAEYSAEERRYAMRFAAAHVGIDPKIINPDPSPDVEATDEIESEMLVPAMASVFGSSDDR